MQLPPVVTATAEELHRLASAARTSHEALKERCLTYGEDSAFSAFAKCVTPDVILLDEHYRCHPTIIGYCNRFFYEDRLAVLTTPDTRGPRGIEWIDVDSPTERDARGGTLNHGQAEAIVAWLASNASRGDTDVGVVTPFRAQANLLRDRVAAAGYEGVAVGTAHTFQGSERAVILFSTVLSKGAAPGTVCWLEQERNLVNVAVSRARNRLVVFGHRASLETLGAPTLVSLASFAQESRRPPVAAPGDAVARLSLALMSAGIPFRLGQTDEGRALSLAVDAGGLGRIDVELDEFPRGDADGRRQRQNSIRDEVVGRLGWRVLRVPAWRALLEPEVLATEIRAYLA
jgi:hypothetical protein